MKARHVASVAVVAGLILAACGSDDESSSEDTTASAGTEATTEGTEAMTEGTEAAGGGGDCVVGVSWNNFQEPRWGNFDEPAIKAAVEAAGGSYVSNDAKSSAETQASNVENLLSQGANVLVILAQDGTAILPSVEAATTAGVPVIAYDRLIEDPNALYVTFDNAKVGELQAQALFDIQPTGNWVIIKGNSADANADFLRGGADNVIGAAVEAGDITIVGEDYTDNWDPANALRTTPSMSHSCRTTAWPVA
jgi:D-xylose transport system substrate-binding protein